METIKYRGRQNDINIIIKQIRKELQKLKNEPTGSKIKLEIICTKN